MEIKLREVTKKFDKALALDKVSLTFGPGQIVAVVGLNGAGKTTLLRCLATIAGVSDGEIWFDGERLTRARLDLRKRFHFLPDFPFLFHGYSVVRNIGIMLNLYGRDVPGIEDLVMELLEELDLVPLVAHPVQGLSRGQSYKTALAGLIATDPELWLLDEPFASGMDPQGIRVFKERARAAAASGRTVIYSTQLLDMAEIFSDQICVLHEGQVRLHDSSAMVRSSELGAEQQLGTLFRKLREEKS